MYHYRFMKRTVYMKLKSEGTDTFIVRLLGIAVSARAGMRKRWGCRR